VPLIAGRILGWLTIAAPAEQTAAQIAEAIGASRASLTTNLRLLASVGFLGQRTRPGERTARRLVDDDLAARFLPPGQRIAVRACRRATLRRLLVTATECQATGLWGSVLCRKRYLDDQVRAALDAGADQLVVLGAGMGTDAEVDQSGKARVEHHVYEPSHDLARRNCSVSILGCPVR
jgi:Leucine carboxyl methyltransferase